MSDIVPDWKHINFRLADGIGEAVLHDGDHGVMVWSADAHREITEMFAWLAVDRSVKVLILTGAGERFCTEIDPAGFRALSFRSTWSEAQRMLNGYLAAETLVIAAANGPALIHAELLVMADIVLACPEAEFADRAHFVRNVVPGDGAHTVWSLLLGPTRASYFHLTGEAIGAEEAKRLGIVHELHDRNRLLPRARELAASLAARPAPLLAYTRAVLRMGERRQFAATLDHGMALQGVSMFAAGMRLADES